MSRRKQITNSVKRVRLAIALLILIVLIGTFGYMIIDEQDFADSLYMTLITISTVGFGEVWPLSDVGRIFTIFLILISFSTYAYAISIITSHLVELKLLTLLGKRLKKYKTMEKHVIIVGFGRNGRQVANEFIEEGQDFIVIESDQELINQHSEKPIKFLDGDATDDETLLKAGINKAKALISTLPNDADNLFIVLSARSLNERLKIISRASSENAQRKLRVAGVDNVIMPEKVGGTHMAILVTQPDTVEFLDRLSMSDDNVNKIEELDFKCMPEKYKSKTIKELNLRERSGVNIIGFKSPEGLYVVNPSPDTHILPDTKLFVLGTRQQVKTLEKIIFSDACDI
ncbi:MAG: TrkA family potassium uptake protein [Hyphomicrobiales bacterium]